MNQEKVGHEHAWSSRRPKRQGEGEIFGWLFV